MLGQFLAHGAVYTLGAVLSRGITFFLLPIYTFALLPRDFAVVDYLTVIGAFVSVTIALEITQAVARFVPEHLEDRGKVRQMASTGFWFTFLVHLVLIVGAVAFATPLAEIMFDESSDALVPVVTWAALSFLTNNLVGYLRNLLRAELRPKASTSVAILHAASIMAMTAWLLLFSDQPDAGAAMQALTYGGAFTTAIGIWLCRSSLGLQFSPRALTLLVGFSAPLVLSSVGVIAAQFLDRIVITELLGIETLAPYVVAARIALMVSLLMVGFQNALTPLIYSRLHAPDTPEQVAQLLRWFTGLVLIGISGLMLFDQWIIDLITPDGYAEAVILTPVLVVATVVASAYIFFPGLSIARKTGTIAAINLVAAAANLGLNWLLIPVWGLMGAAVATLVSALMALSGMIFFSQRQFRIPIMAVPSLAAIALGLAASFAAALLARTELQMILFGLAAIAFNAAIVVALGLIRTDELAQLRARLLRSGHRNT